MLSFYINHCMTQLQRNLKVIQTLYNISLQSTGIRHQLCNHFHLRPFKCHTSRHDQTDITGSKDHNFFSRHIAFHIDKALGSSGGINAGRAVAWKRAGRFVDGARFERAQRLWYSESPNACENYRACRIYDYLEASRPDLRGDPEAICSLFGYPPEALAEARRAEAAQPAEEVE